jgi:carboxylate-amine ligase
MKDFYWDIRPKPEYGTIEVRVMDTPLTVGKAAQIAAFIQSLARYLILERPYSPQEKDYLVYTFNRFQACRFGYEGVYVSPRNHEHRSLSEEILDTLDKIESHAIALKADEACAALRREVLTASSDVDWLRRQHAQTKSLAEVVQRQCARWRA